MSSIHDWASEAAEYIYHLSPRPTEERIAAIIATFADPLVTLLNESRRAHRHDGLYGKTCCPQCTCRSDDDEESEPNGDGPCNCEAGAWNDQVDAVLAGKPAHEGLGSAAQDCPGTANGRPAIV